MKMKGRTEILKVFLGYYSDPAYFTLSNNIRQTLNYKVFLFSQSIRSIQKTSRCIYVMLNLNVTREKPKSQYLGGS